MEELECLECGWTGDVLELHCSDEDADGDKPVNEIKFNQCPDCGCTEFDDVECDDEDDE